MLQDLVPFLIIGLTAGAVYGLASVGLVLTYKTSGVFNFAYGALATVAAYSFYEMHVRQGWSWIVSAAIVVLVLGPLMGLGMELLARRIQGRALAVQVAATVGLLVVIQALAVLIYGTKKIRRVKVFLPEGSVDIAGTPVQYASLITLGVAIVTTVALTVFFKRSRRGVAMRAVVDNPELLALAGTNPKTTRRLSWVVGCTVVAGSGVLFAPLLPLDPVQLTLLIVAAFGAAAVGAFSNLQITFVGGLAIGVLASLCTKWFTTGLLAGVPPTLPFIVLFVVLLVFPRRFLAGRTFSVTRVQPSWTAPASMHLVAAAGLLLLLVLVPTFAGLRLADWTTAVATTIVFLSLGLLVRTSGQVSLCHVSFTAIGACAFSHFAAGSGLPWGIALVLCGLVAVPIGAILATPAIRLTGIYLALATFGFGILLQGMFYTQEYMFGDSGLGLPMPRPELSWLPISGDKGFYYLVVAIAAAVAILVVAIDKTRLGRLLRGMADSPTALETSGATVNVSRVLVFCLSAFLAAIGGALVGAGQTSVSADTYQPLLSLTYFVLICIVFGNAPWNAVIAAGFIVLVPAYIQGTDVAIILQLLFGLFAIVFAALPSRARDVPSWLRRATNRLPRRQKSIPAPSAASDVPDRVRPGTLQVEGLQVRFGGLVAVDGLSFSAPTGKITGLIGPNGAGKTTTFNACSGLTHPSGGRVMLDGRNISRLSPAARARRGLGRTFQKIELLESMTVLDNVGIGGEGVMAGANPLRHMWSRRVDRQAVDSSALYALELCGVSHLAGTSVASLSTGQRRLVELARCLAGPFRILLLDEPSSGLDPVETERFGEILRRVVEERGVGILLVEHDMSLVFDICDKVYVLDFGKPVFDGTPSEIANSDVVRAAYLGDAAVEEAIDPAATLVHEGA